MQSPPKTTPPVPPRRTGDPRTTPRLTLNAALLAMARSVILIGGLVIIADLATLALSQRTTAQDGVGQFDAANLIVNVVLFSMLGAIVARQTGLFYLSALAGLLAALIDAAVVIAAWTAAPRAGGNPPLDEYLLQNVAFGVIPAAVSGFVSSLVDRVSGPRSR